jgi:hypothetical protein
MRIYKTKKVTIDWEYEDEYLCDLCNKEITLKEYNAYECNISINYGSSWPDGSGCGVKYNVDLCEPCSEKFISLMKKSNIKVQEKDWYS